MIYISKEPYQPNQIYDKMMTVTQSSKTHSSEAFSSCLQTIDTCTHIQTQVIRGISHVYALENDCVRQQVSNKIYEYELAQKRKKKDAMPITPN